MNPALAGSSRFLLSLSGARWRKEVKTKTAGMLHAGKGTEKEIPTGAMREPA